MKIEKETKKEERIPIRSSIKEKTELLEIYLHNTENML